MLILWGLAHIFVGGIIDQQFAGVHIGFGCLLIAASVFAE